MRKTQYYEVAVEVDDNGEFDAVNLRDAITGGIQRQMDEGNMTPLSDETTLILGFVVNRVPSDETTSDKIKSLISKQLELWDGIRALEKEVGNDLEGLQDRIEAIASGVDSIADVTPEAIDELVSEFALVGTSADAREIAASNSDTEACDWEYIDGPETGVGAEYWLRNEDACLEAYICIDQGEVVSCEINKAKVGGALRP